MDVHFEAVKGPAGLRALLEANGWRLDEGEGDHFTARHPDVMDQPTARQKLNRMGLLTSARLRIEFGLTTRVDRQWDGPHVTPTAFAGNR
jgi:hypothetical protein